MGQCPSTYRGPSGPSQSIEFHMGAKLAPPTALARALAWLRATTSADLATYAKAAAKQGRLESRHGSEIEQALSEEARGHSRNAALVEWTVPEESRTSASTRKQADATKRVARPFAHPYFWAGFIYTGL
jgi:CHAT domain-containing protein